METENLITEKELSKIIGISKVSLHFWRNKGKIPYYKLGTRTIRYKLSDVLKKLNE
jgi:predicted site-specific integrase-resolvase